MSSPETSGGRLGRGWGLGRMFHVLGRVNQVLGTGVSDSNCGGVTQCEEVEKISFGLVGVCGGVGLGGAKA